METFEWTWMKLRILNLPSIAELPLNKYFLFDDTSLPLHENL